MSTRLRHQPLWVLLSSSEMVAARKEDAEETEKILRWLESPGIRLVHLDGEWACPIRGAARHPSVHDAVNTSRQSLVPFDGRRNLATVHQPAR